MDISKPRQTRSITDAFFHSIHAGDDAWLCAYALPVLRASHVATWCANVGMALATLRTVRGQAMAPRTQLIMRTVVGIVGTSAVIRYELMVRVECGGLHCSEYRPEH